MEKERKRTAPVFRRRRSSVPEMSRVWVPCGTSSTGMYSSLPGR